MRPKNNREREIVRLHDRLPDLTEPQMRWVRESGIPWQIFENDNGRAWCEKCGGDLTIKEGAKYAVCPHCGKRLPVNYFANRNKRNFANHGQDFVQFIAAFKGYQVIRYFVAAWHGHRKQESSFTIREVMQKWCQPGRPTVTLGVPIVMLPGWCEIPYSHNGTMSIKGSGSWYYSEWMRVRIYPRIRLLPVYRKTIHNARFFTNIDAEKILAVIYSNPYFEALYKAGKHKELKALMPHVTQFNKFWPSIRVALRHGYEPSNWYDYLDYLSMLAFLHKDMHSPHYVAPTDWVAMHGLICTQARNKRLEMERKREEKERIRRAEEEARLEAERKEARKSFSRRIAKFKDLWIVGYGLEIRPLMTIKEFAEEGDAMGHCVFSQAYYKKTNSLIMSARDASTNKRVETIEVDLTQLAILQSRGHGNQPTDRHDDIINLVKGAMPTIDAMAHPNMTHTRAALSRS